jgi:uncharacterized protein YhjY with autotransporter beta-barrel domain
MVQPGLYFVSDRLLHRGRQPRRVLAASVLVLLTGFALAGSTAAPAAAGAPRPATYDLQFPGGPFLVSEGGTLQIPVELVGVTCSPFTGVDWGVSVVPTGGNPAEPRDLLLPSPNPVTFNQFPQTISVDVGSTQDADFDDEEARMLVEIPSFTAGTIDCSSQQPTTLTYAVNFKIIDDDSPPPMTVRITPTNSAAAEGSDGDITQVNATIEVLNPPPGPWNATVDLITFDNTATVADDDYVPRAVETLNFSNSSPGPYIRTVSYLGDKRPEPDEVFWFKVFNPIGMTLEPGQDKLFITIQNDDANPQARINNANLSEGSGGGQVLVNVSVEVNDAPIGVPLHIAYHTDNLGTSLDPAQADVDYVTTSGVLIITASSSFEIHQIQVPVIQDDIVEGSEEFFVYLDSIDNQGTIIDNQGSVVILDDDVTPPVVHLSIEEEVSVEEVDEGGTVAMIFNVHREDISGSFADKGAPISVDFATADGTALAGEDYVAESGTLVFGPTEFDKQISIVITGDNEPEGNEDFTVNLTNAVNAVIDVSQGVGTIDNDDTLTIPQVSIDDVAVVEGHSGQVEMLFHVKLDQATASQVTFTYRTEDGTATAADNDFVAVAPTVVVIPPGETSATLSLHVVGDSAFENDETFEVVLDSISPNAVFGDRRGAATITNDDLNLERDLSIDDVTVVEGDDGTVAATFTVTLSAALSTTVLVDYSTESDTATAPGDYLSATGQVSFGPNETSKSVAVQVVGDDVDEANETFKVRLSNAQGGASIARAVGIGTITDDDDLGHNLSINDVTVAEGDDGTVAATFTVTLSNPLATTVLVDYATENDTASSPGDYQPATGQLSFGPNETSKSLVVQVVGDDVDEADEAFKVRLANVQGGATIERAVGIGNITDDDGAVVPPPNLTIDDFSVVEGNSGERIARFDVRIDRATDGEVSFQIATQDDSATVADGDYQALSGRLVIPAGTTTVGVPVVVRGDQKVEGDERFFARLSAVQGAHLIRAQAVGTIVNDDEPPRPLGTIRFVRATATAESGGEATVTLERLGSAEGRASVVLITEGGSAQAGEDYQPVRQVVEWASGALGTVDVPLSLIDDGIQENDEQVGLRLVEPQGATLGQPDRGELTILDDDTPMRLEIVGGAELNAKVGDTVELKVKVLRADGQPVSGALIAFEATSGPVRFAQEPATARSDAEGVAVQRVVVGPLPGVARVRAFLGEQAEALFTVRVAGNLGESPGGGGAQGVGGILDQSCGDATGQLAEACRYLYGLDDPAERRQALDELTPRGVVAQVRASLQAPVNQKRNIGQRLDALRGGVPLQTLDQLALNLQGQGLGVGALQQAFAKGGQPVKGSDDRLYERVELALAKAQGRALPALAKADPGASGVDDAESRWGAFVNGRLSFGDAPRRNQDPGYDFETQGVTAGADYRVSSTLVVGAAVGWLNTESKLDVDGGGIKTGGTSLNLYATWYRENVYVEAVVGYGRNDYEFTRVLVFPRPFQGRDTFLARGRPDSRQLSADLGVGYDFRSGEALSVTGIGRLSWIDTQIDPYAESGSGPFDLTFAEQNVDSLQAEAGIEMTYPWSVSWGVLQPMLRVSYLHEFEDAPTVIRARFTADGGQRFFVVQSENPDRNYLNLAAGISATLPRGWATFLQYDTDLQRDEIDIYTVTGGARFQF